MFIPETGDPETLGTLQVANERIDSNVLDAAARGTREGMMLAANVGAILISFIALVALANLALGWLGGLVGRPELSLQRILALVFAPFAWLLGVPTQDCEVIGGLLGTRTVLNELIAYFDLGKMKDTLTPKAFSIATIAMCSFANISSIGIQLGGIGALVPERRADLARREDARHQHALKRALGRHRRRDHALERIQRTWNAGSGAAKVSSLYRRGGSGDPRAFADPLAYFTKVPSRRYTTSGCALTRQVFHALGRTTFFARPTASRPRITHHEMSNSHQWWPCAADRWSAW